jgi:hypothetical protein
MGLIEQASRKRQRPEFFQFGGSLVTAQYCLVGERVQPALNRYGISTLHRTAWRQEETNDLEGFLNLGGRQNHVPVLLRPGGFALCGFGQTLDEA